MSLTNVSGISVHSHTQPVRTYASSRRGQQFLKPPVSFDTVLFSIAMLMVCFSLVMLYSTTGVTALERYGDTLFFVRRQAIAALLGVGGLFVMYKLPLAMVRKASPYLLLLSVGLLLLPLLPGLGSAAGGAQRWISLGGIAFQPGEFVKLSFVVFLAGYYARHGARIRSFSAGLVKPFLYVGLLGTLYLLQPDFGSTAIIALVAIVMSLASGARLRHIIACGLVAAACMAVLVMVSPYRMARVLSFLSPLSDSAGSGYQLIQSLIALGSGEFFGVGLGLSQQKLFFLPAAHTDFIFAVIGEELGFVGCVTCMLLYLGILWRGLKIARSNSSDLFVFAMAVGLTVIVVMPALLNFGVVTGLLPTKGLVLPLLGFGGSSLLSCLLAIGLLLNVGKNAEVERRSVLPQPVINRRTI